MRAADFDLIFVPDPAKGGENYWPSRWMGKLSTARVVAPDEIVAAARDATRPILFIGHSLGAIAIARAAAELAGADVRGAFLVAPPDGAALSDREGDGAAEIPRAPLPWPSVMVASRTDPTAAFDHSEALAGDWGSEFVDAGDSGRIDDESGHGPWPDGLLRLAKFMKGLG